MPDGVCQRWSAVEVASSVEAMADGVIWARDLAAARMAKALPVRWGHVQAVAKKADSLRPVLGADAELVVMAAWLHDIGYAPDVQDTGFHPLDGARLLRGLGVDSRLCGLVANHSGARHEAELRDLIGELAEFVDERTFARDSLWYCDMTTSPVGLPVTFDARLAEMRERYGEEHVVPRAITAASDEIRAAIAHVLAQCGFVD